MASDWSFARKPFWLFSHVFAATVVVSFVLLGSWQLSRHYERAALNDVISARSKPPAAAAADVVDEDPAELDYRLVTATGIYVDGDLVRIANRSQGGLAGEHVVGLFRLDDGRLLLVNRGFVPLQERSEATGAPTGAVAIDGWLRLSAEKGWLGATDSGEGAVAPRLDVSAIGGRVDGLLIPVWLQLGRSDDGAATATFPDPVPLPELGGGPHLSYMGQWWVFATLGVMFYGAMLRRNARSTAGSTSVPIPVDQS